MKILNLFFIFLFLLPAALPYKDPDLFIWIALYLYGVMVYYLAIRKKQPMALYSNGWLVYSSYGPLLVFQQQWRA